ncbi:MAG TPA: hypothetical protein VJ715_03295 [Pyrinomonadaceae bacterium]|nr:hypothetical protein [Pyrinomonadaceae bacterium]
MRRLYIYGWRCALLIILSAAPVFSQTVKEGALKAVPESQRAQLVERLNSYLEHERAGQYGELYDLLYDQDVSKAEFVKARESADQKGVGIRLLKFTPTETTVMQEEVEGAGGVGVSVVNTYQIFGKAEVLRAGDRAKDRVFIGARWQNSNWYFSLPGIMTVD